MPVSGWEVIEDEPKIAREYLANIASGLCESVEHDKKQARGQSHSDIEVKCEVLQGDPACTIVEYVKGHPQVVTIAMATHRRRGMDRWVFGSVAEHILHNSPVPLLLVRGSEDKATQVLGEIEYNNILVPLDGSQFGELALEQAQQLAVTTGARLILVSAVPGSQSAMSLLTPTEEQLLWNQEFEWRSCYLEEKKARLHSEGVAAESHVLFMMPTEAILEVSKRERADLIVMSTHGRGGVQRLWLGSVASDVVRRVTQPVLLVRAVATQAEHVSLIDRLSEQFTPHHDAAKLTTA